MNEQSLIPKLRFRGFNDPWEQCKLSTLLTESRIKGHSGQEAKKITVKLWGKGAVEKNDYGGSLATQYYIRSSQQFIYSKLDFLNSAFAVIPNELDGFETTLDLPAFDCHGINPFFLFCKVIQPSFYLKNGSIADGSRKAKRIHANVFLDMSISVPCINEQNYVAFMLGKLDKLITLHHRKYETLKNVKKSLSEKLFPKNGEVFPVLRFSGFSDVWEQRKFSEMFELLTNNTLSRAELSLNGGVARNIHYGDILVKFDECLMNVAELPYIPNSNFIQKFLESKLRKGDIVIADTAEDETVGKCLELLDTQGENIISGLHTIPCRPRQKFASGYLGYFMNSPSFHNGLIPLMQGIKVSSISKTALYNTVLRYPKTTNEQEKIARFMLALDNLITLHQRK